MFIFYDQNVRRGNDDDDMATHVVIRFYELFFLRNRDRKKNGFLTHDLQCDPNEKIKK